MNYLRLPERLLPHLQRLHPLARSTSINAIEQALCEIGTPPGKIESNNTQTGNLSFSCGAQAKDPRCKCSFNDTPPPPKKKSLEIGLPPQINTWLPNATKRFVSCWGDPLDKGQSMRHGSPKACTGTAHRPPLAKACPAFISKRARFASGFVSAVGDFALRQSKHVRHIVHPNRRPPVLQSLCLRQVHTNHMHRVQLQKTRRQHVLQQHFHGPTQGTEMASHMASNAFRTQWLLANSCEGPLSNVVWGWGPSSTVFTLNTCFVVHKLTPGQWGRPLAIRLHLRKAPAWPRPVRNQNVHNHVGKSTLTCLTSQQRTQSHGQTS